MLTVPTKPNDSSIPRNMSGIVLDSPSQPIHQWSSNKWLQLTEQGAEIHLAQSVQIPVSQNLLGITKWFYFMLLSFWGDRLYSNHDWNTILMTIACFLL